MRAASGDVQIFTVGGEARLNTASGDLQAATVAGDAKLKPASGDIQLGDVGGRLEANTEGDSPPVELRANTMSGDVAIVRA